MLILFTLLLSTYLLTSARNFSWFKTAEYHTQNILALGNQWTECNQWSDAYYNTIGADDTNTQWPWNFTASCITFKVPLNWDDPTSDRTINYTITRVYSRNDIANNANAGAFWMMPGGAGGPAYDAAYPFAVPWLSFLNGTYELYVYDHRGLPSSTVFTCPGLEHDFMNCSEYTADFWGDNAYFSVYQAALDIAYVIDLFGDNFSPYNKDNQIILAFSYGTYLLNKYLQLYPNQVRAVIMDGVCVGDQCKFSKYDNGTQDAAITFFKRCGEDSFCNSQFVPIYGDDIIEAMDYIYGLFDDNGGNMPCNPLNDITPIPKATFQGFLYYLFSDTHRKNLIMPLLKRIARCNDDDKTVIKTWVELASSEDGGDGVILLRLNTYLSELWYGDDPTIGGPDADILLEKVEKSYISSRLGPYLRPIWDDWEKYLPPMDLYNKYADLQIPVLLLNGDLDAATNVTWARNAASYWNANTDGVDRYYVEIPNAPHGSSIQSPIVNYTDNSVIYERDYVSCGMYIIKSFIEDPYYEPDTRCLDWLLPFDWRVSSNITKSISKGIYGTRNAWGEIEYDYVDTANIYDANVLLNVLLLVCGSVYLM